MTLHRGPGSGGVARRQRRDAMPALPGFAAAQLLAELGAAAIIVGNVVALRQERLKLLIAYSTLAVVSAVLFRRGGWKGKTV